MLLNDYIGLIGYSGVVLGLIFTTGLIFSNLVLVFKKKFVSTWLLKTLTLMICFCLALAVLALGILLFNNAFEFPLVFDSVEKSMPWFQKLGGLWSGQASSLLFWSFILSFGIVFVTRISKSIIPEKNLAIITIVLGISLLFFLVPVLVISNPFEKLWQMVNGLTKMAVFPPENASLIVPVDGVGMNPSLRHIAMLLHPPFLYLGLVGFFIPFAVLTAALIRGNLDNKMIAVLMPVSIISWIFLTLGMFLGSWWAYTILGWGGYWGWDAVEISGLIPWLLSFGLIHSLAMQLSGKKFLRWIIVFSGLVFISIILGILITRSGILESVHAYSVGIMGPVLSVFILVTICIFGASAINKWPSLKRSDAVKKRSAVDNLTHLFNYVLLVLVVIYLMGQTFPLTSQIINGAKQNWVPEQYEHYSSPFLYLLLLVTAAHPLADLFEKDRKKFIKKLSLTLAVSLVAAVFLTLKIKGGLSVFAGFWAAFFLIATWLNNFIQEFHFSALFIRNRKFKGRCSRVGSIILHLGVGLLAIGIIGQESASVTYEFGITDSEPLEIGGYLIGLDDMTQVISSEGITISKSKLSFYENSKRVFTLSPQINYYPKMNMLYSLPMADTTLLRDVQVLIKEWKNSMDGLTIFHVTINPLMIWIWIGGAMLVLGGAISLIKPRPN